LTVAATPACRSGSRASWVTPTSSASWSSRGAKVNTPDNSQPTSPLSMAIRGKRTEVVKALIELGAQVPPGMHTG
jgi:hypothetical protein